MQRYFITSESTYEILRQTLNAQLGYPNQLGQTIFHTPLQAPRDSFRRVLLAVDTSISGYSTINNAIAPLLAGSAMEELDEATYLTALASAGAGTGGVSSWNDLTDRPTEFPPAPHAHTVTDLTATGTPSASTFLRGDGAWAAAGGSSGPTVVALTFASTLATNASTGDIFDVTLTGNTTLANPTNPVNGKTIRWRIRQDATGSRTVTLGSKFVIPSSATSPLPFSTAANKMDVLAATYHAGRDKWDVIAFVPGY